MATSSVTLEIEEDTRAEGLGRIPFRMGDGEPNEESLGSIRAAREIISEGREGFATVDEMFAAMGL